MIKLDKETKVTSAVIRSIISQIACNLHNELNPIDRAIAAGLVQFNVITKQTEDGDTISGFTIDAKQTTSGHIIANNQPKNFIRFEVLPVKTEKTGDNVSRVKERLLKTSQVLTTGNTWVSTIISSVLTATANWEQVLVDYCSQSSVDSNLNKYKNIRVIYSNGLETICLEINIHNLFEVIRGQSSYTHGFNNIKFIDKDGTAVPFLARDIEESDEEYKKRRSSISMSHPQY